MNQKIEFGKQGEDHVSDYLEKKGFEILKKNFKLKSGEIDIIAKHNDLLIFVEVKTRRHEFFSISQVITLSKQNFIIKTALNFVSKESFGDYILRFDVALVTLDNDKNFQISYITNAFSKSEEL